MRNLFRRKPTSTGTGEEFEPGGEHYRAYVGPPQDYDLISAMVFNLLTSAGLRQHHRLLDVGCGSLRVGRLLIPYLNAGNYVGVEPNEWLVKDGILNELGRDLIKIKRPRFSYKTSLEEFNESLELDFAVAQSIFSHTSAQLTKDWLAQISKHLKDSGAFFATFIQGEEDFDGEGWVYPGCVNFTSDSMAAFAQESGLNFRVLDWRHPRQTWAVFYKDKFDTSVLNGAEVSWNRMMEREMNG